MIDVSDETVTPPPSRPDLRHVARDEKSPARRAFDLHILGDLMEGRANHFDSLRLLAAALVIFGHAYAITQGTIQNEPLWRYSHQRFHSGTFAVRIFFVISGFLITASYLRSKSLGVFVRNRLLRIYPALVVAVLVTMWVIGPLTTTLPLDRYLTDTQTYAYLKTLTLRLHGANDRLPGVFLDNPVAGSVNGSLWTLFYEVVCYAMVAVLGVAGLLRRRVLLPVFLLSLVIRPVILQLDPQSQVLGGESLFMGQAFLGGALIYLFRQEMQVSLGLLLAACTTFLVGIGLGFGNLLMPLVGAYAIICLAYHPSLPLGQGARYGDFSYGLYVYAFPIQQAIVHLSEQSMSPLNNFLLALPLTLVAAALSWKWVERPFLTLKARRPIAS